MKVRFYKDRQKFSAAHFTLFADGSCERLHGHNYGVEVEIQAKLGPLGLLFPFHEVKPLIQEICEQWDERILIPGDQPWFRIQEHEGQVKCELATTLVQKYYEFPSDDVVILNTNNISSENLALLFHNMLETKLAPKRWPIAELSVTISESSGQAVTYSRSIS